jgi:hypothetical protein
MNRAQADDSIRQLEDDRRNKTEVATEYKVVQI